MTTTVYVWRPGRGRRTDLYESLKHPGWTGRVSRLLGGFGHVALEVDFEYLSFWPAVFAGEASGFSGSYEEDVRRCERDADSSSIVEGLNETALLGKWVECTDLGFDEVANNCAIVSTEALLTGFEERDRDLFDYARMFFRTLERGKDQGREDAELMRSIRARLDNGTRGDIFGLISPNEVGEIAEYMNYLA